MSGFDNLYLCPVCDNTGPLHEDDMICDKCNFELCFVAKHVNEGTRKFWILKEKNLSKWRFEKRFTTILKDGLPINKSINRIFHKSVKKLFKLFDENKSNMDEIFPKYIRDFKRTTGKRERGWKRRGSAAKQNRNSLRGSIYEGAMNKICEEVDVFENIRVPIDYQDKNGIDKSYEPDYWFKFNNQMIPIEFKTFKAGGLIKSNFIKGLKQSRRYGLLSESTHQNNNQYSGMIICCPEERKFSCSIIDHRVERIID